MGEIDLHRGTEKLKQQLESQLDYSQDAIYQVVDDWGYGFIDARNMYRFFKNSRSKATEDDCIAIIRRLDLDADSKLSREEFLTGLRAQEPFSKMIVREKMARNEAKEVLPLKKSLRKDETVIENWNRQETLKTRALDRSYKTVMSVSPLKHRVDLDVQCSPIRTM